MGHELVHRGPLFGRPSQALLKGERYILYMSIGAVCTVSKSPDLYAILHWTRFKLSADSRPPIHLI